jgi:hypothetical protein
VRVGSQEGSYNIFVFPTIDGTSGIAQPSGAKGGSVSQELQLKLMETFNSFFLFLLQQREASIAEIFETLLGCFSTLSQLAGISRKVCEHA